MSDEPPSMSSSDPVQPKAAPRTSMAAVWSLVFGVSSFCLWLFGSVPALILGTIALVKINAAQGRLEGKGLAIAGLVTGGVGVIAGLFSMAFLAGLMMPILNKIQGEAKLTRQMTDMKVLMIACRIYAGDHDGNFPDELKDLYPDHITDEAQLMTRGEKTGEELPYIYFSGYRDDSPTKTVPMIATPATIARHRVLGLVGGEVVKVPDKEFERLMKVREDSQ